MFRGYEVVWARLVCTLLHWSALFEIPSKQMKRKPCVSVFTLAATDIFMAVFSPQPHNAQPSRAFYVYKTLWLHKAITMQVIRVAHGFNQNGDALRNPCDTHTWVILCIWYLDA